MATNFDTERHLRYEVVTRMRESWEAAEKFPIGSTERHAWNFRAQAFNEVYTEIKGMDIGVQKRARRKRG